MSGESSTRTRALFVGAALISLVVTVVFATVGDGVAVAEATGLRAVVVEAGHTLVWALLAAAFAIAAARARWSRLSNAIAITAGVVYLLFLIAVFLWP